MKRLASESPQRSSHLLCDECITPFAIHNEVGASPLVLVCDHAGRAVPESLDLGVPPAEMDRHIAWDIGAGGLCLALCDHAGRLRGPPALFAPGRSTATATRTGPTPSPRSPTARPSPATRG